MLFFRLCWHVIGISTTLLSAHLQVARIEVCDVAEAGIHLSGVLNQSVLFEVHTHIVVELFLEQVVSEHNCSWFS
jgi:hypothetical protein